MEDTNPNKTANIEVQKSILVNTSVTQAFSFHADINNISKVLPPFFKIKINKLDWPFQTGSEAELVFFLFGFLPFFVWKLKMLDFKVNYYFIDGESSGFFKFFEHKHEFIQSSNNIDQCEIRDTVKLSTGEGFINKLFDRLVLQPMVFLFLTFKLHDTKRFLERE
ncbi:MAG: hypothetical protein SFU25_09635 [Candidatus Caenarcaniphilales bacterium]|nr:hypothetical protein [Candidatus Caenarcaniphilales bacterium]